MHKQNTELLLLLDDDVYLRISQNGGEHWLPALFLPSLHCSIDGHCWLISLPSVLPPEPSRAVESGRICFFGVVHYNRIVKCVVNVYDVLRMCNSSFEGL